MQINFLPSQQATLAYTSSNGEQRPLRWIKSGGIFGPAQFLGNDPGSGLVTGEIYVVVLTDGVSIKPAQLAPPGDEDPGLTAIIVKPDNNTLIVNYASNEAFERNWDLL